jgi:hypothetical protein
MNSVEKMSIGEPQEVRQAGGFRVVKCLYQLVNIELTGCQGLASFKNAWFRHSKHRLL